MQHTNWEDSLPNYPLHANKHKSTVGMFTRTLPFVAVGSQIKWQQILAIISSSGMLCQLDRNRYIILHDCSVLYFSLDLLTFNIAWLTKHVSCYYNNQRICNRLCTVIAVILFIMWSNVDILCEFGCVVQYTLFTHPQKMGTCNLFYKDISS